MHSHGVQEGVQTWGFVRRSRWARNAVVAPCQFLPATKLNVHLFERHDRGSLRDQWPSSLSRNLISAGDDFTSASAKGLRRIPCACTAH